MTRTVDSGPDVASHEGGPVLRKSLRRVDMVLLTVAATIAIDTVAQIAGLGGASAFGWTIFVCLTFFVPYALVTAEMGSSFRQEGGPQVWVRLAFGRGVAAVSTFFYWITNPIWLGGSLAFISATTWSTYIHPLDSGGFADYLFKFAFIWAAIAVSMLSLRYGKVLLNVGAVAKLALIGLFVLALVLYAARHGLQGYRWGDFAPSAGNALAVTPVLLFALVGLEAQNGAAEEMRDPRRDVPVSVAVSGTISVLAYLVPVFGILAVLPPGEVTGASGFLGAVTTVFSVFGPAGGPLLTAAAVTFVFVLMIQGSAWMVASDRVQAVAAQDDGFPRWFGAFHPRLGTPVRVNLLSGAVASAFTVAATVLLGGTSGTAFSIVLTTAITTLLLSYLVILPAAVRLRSRYPLADRPYRVPFGRTGLLVAVGASYLWVMLGAWMAIFPGTLEGLLGIDYDFEAVWHASRAEFEAFTLGTLAAILLVAFGCRRWAARHERTTRSAAN